MSSSAEEVIEKLSADEKMQEIQKAGKMSIKEDAVTFTNLDFPKIEKFILDDGYEDSIKVQFTEQAPILKFPLESFEFENPRSDADGIATKLGDFLSSLLENRFKLSCKKMCGVEIYTITTDRATYVSVVRHGIIAHLLPAFFVKTFGKQD